MPSKRRKIEYGAAAVRAGSEHDEPRSEVIDTLANVMHYAASLGLDANRCIGAADMHFTAEQ